MIAIVDYGLGNLFSVQQACHHCGMPAATITSDKNAVLNADAVILPGVGAFGDAMQTLHKLDLVEPLRDLAAAGKPLMGICLGLQLLMSVSHEFGDHAGLDIIPGEVVPFEPATITVGEGQRPRKVPQVGWNAVCEARESTWATSPLNGLESGVFMYFVHSYYVRPATSELVLSTSTYGDTEFCSSLAKENIFACQFHPERSGTQGLQIYQNFARMLYTT